MTCQSILKLFPLYLLLGIFSPSTLVGNYYCPNLTLDNETIAFNEILDYYDHVFNGDKLSEFTAELQQLFLELNLNTVDDAGCDRGHLIRTGYDEFPNGNFGLESQLNLRWNESSPLCQEYFNGYLDLRTLERWDTTLTEPGATFNLPGTSQWKLFILNARCSETQQSSYYIIIVDRDLNLNTLGNSDHGSSIGDGFRLKKNENESNLLVYPNPLIGTSGQTAFYLFKDQNISLYIINGSTGKLVKSIFSDFPFREGEHTQLIATEELVPGVYFIVLQTDSKRLVKKMIKI